MKTLQYLVYTLLFTRKEFNKIMLPVLNKVLVKSKIGNKFPQNLIYSSKEVLGLGFEDLYIYIIQEVGKLYFYLEERNNNSLSGPLICTLQEWVLIHVGIGNKELLNSNFDKFGKLLPNA